MVIQTCFGSQFYDLVVSTYMGILRDDNLSLNRVLAFNKSTVIPRLTSDPANEFFG